LPSNWIPLLTANTSAIAIRSSVGITLEQRRAVLIDYSVRTMEQWNDWQNQTLMQHLRDARRPPGSQPLILTKTASNCNSTAIVASCWAAAMEFAPVWSSSFGPPSLNGTAARQAFASCTRSSVVVDGHSSVVPGRSCQDPHHTLDSYPGHLHPPVAWVAPTFQVSAPFHYRCPCAEAIQIMKRLLYRSLRILSRPHARPI
jgi:hypothetical protein